ncbi:hypothetical protein SAMN00768000_0162 [Sulfobacillus thermosulfidooxidans DSM 9293]|uniref:Uncharacterized protein n=1 Tax=Sulfobacillus thermosulfidooxidans (strain DSM 9293 / VKM B-1269 / AT-1) TaxID=929705 RepID=A0A1W1W6K7_SULTA|nr:hypothetical protein [Sulfobacillus thermosulfidooxidans]SMC01931.1 hypothetical protein SAMN00768000_0162 [Sulfobacillus thermosulfidooxidans DSM 9293]
MLDVVARLANAVIGIMGLGVIAWGMAHLALTLWHAYQSPERMRVAPIKGVADGAPVVRHVLLITFGLILVGMMVGGGWETLITGLVRWSARWHLPGGRS